MSGYIGNIPVPQATQTRQTFTATASQTTFNTAGYSVGYVDVFLNGVKLAPADYTATNGSDIVLAVGAASGDILEIVAYEIFQVLDQDFTGDFTVDGTTFVVDSTNDRVGVGTSSPARKFEVHGTSSESNRLISVEHTGADYAFISFSDQNTTDDGSVRVGGLGNDLIAFAGNSERMRIDSSGNVGIGTSSPDNNSGFTALTMSNTSGSGGGQVYVKASSAVGVFGADNAGSGTNAKVILQTNTSHPLSFGTSGAERMRIDSSGNLLVGKSATNYQTVGVEAKGNGSLWATADGNGPLVVTRKTSDGTLADFYKDTTKVGSIGTLSSRLHIENGDTGLRIAGDLDQIFPCGSGGGDRDAAIDLGSTGVRFKDLYLSGGVYLGGTGAANLLDDYEEGAFTPTLRTSGTQFTSVSYTFQNGNYTKIGREVVVHIALTVSAVSGGTGALYIGNLPFSIVGRGGGSVGYMSGLNYDSATYSQIGIYTPSGGTDLKFTLSGDNVAAIEVPINNITSSFDTIVSFTYRTT